MAFEKPPVLHAYLRQVILPNLGSWKPFRLEAYAPRVRCYVLIHSGFAYDLGSLRYEVYCESF